jgi:hypothetical protein
MPAGAKWRKVRSHLDRKAHLQIAVATSNGVERESDKVLHDHQNDDVSTIVKQR